MELMEANRKELFCAFEVVGKLYCQRNLYGVCTIHKAISRPSKGVSPGSIYYPNSTTDVITEDSGQEISSKQAKPETKTKRVLFRDKGVLQKA